MCLTLISSFCGSELSQMNTNVRETRINFISYTLDLVSFYDINTRSIDFPKAWVDQVQIFISRKCENFTKPAEARCYN